MSEKEKMMMQEIYDPTDQQLQAEINKAKNLCFELNQTRPSDLKRKNEILKSLIPSFHETNYIEPPFHCDYGTQIHMKTHVYANHNLTILDAGSVTIGNHVFIGPNVCLTTAGHPENIEKRKAMLEYAHPIVLHDNVWIGANVVINPGVEIGEGTIIGSGSVVTKSIEANVVAAGVPCKVIRRINEQK